MDFINQKECIMEVMESTESIEACMEYISESFYFDLIVEKNAKNKNVQEEKQMSKMQNG